MKKNIFLILAFCANLLTSNAQGFDLSKGGYYTNFYSSISTDFTTKEFTPPEVKPYYALITSNINVLNCFKVIGSSVNFYHSSNTPEKVSFKVYDDFIQSNGEYRTIKISNVNAGSKITLAFKTYTYDVDFEATNAEKAKYTLLMSTAQDSILTIFATDTCVTLINTKGNYRLQKISIENTDTVISKLETIKYFDVTKGGIFTDYRSMFYGSFEIDSTYYIDFKSTEADTDQYFKINGSPVSFHYTDTTTGNSAFRAYDTYIQSVGINRTIKVCDLQIGNEIYLSFRANLEANLVATGAQASNYSLPYMKDTTLTIIANSNCVTLTNNQGDFKLYKIAIKGGPATPVIPKIDYLINDTSVYYVSDIKFQSISPMVYLESTDYLHTQIGGGDSIIHHFSKYLYKANHCTDIITQTITQTITDTITITQYRSVSDTLIIEQGEFSKPNHRLCIKMYPNPTVDYIYIETQNDENMGDCSMFITNSYGQKVFESSVHRETHKIKINDIGGKGIYLITFKDSKDNILSTKKLIVE